MPYSVGVCVHIKYYYSLFTDNVTIIQIEMANKIFQHKPNLLFSSIIQSYYLTKVTFYMNDEW